MTNQDLNHAFAYDHDCLRLSGPNKKIHHICHQNMSHNVGKNVVLNFFL